MIVNKNQMLNSFFKNQLKHINMNKKTQKIIIIIDIEIELNNFLK